jgi:hypothetical protein
MDENNYLKRTFRWLHTIWAIIGAGVCVLLATAQGGHPPGLVFVPVAAAIWLAGHVLFWGTRKLAIRGKRLAGDSKAASGKWPLILIVLVLLSGILSIFGLLGIFWQVVSENNWLRKLPVPLAIWIPSTLCFFGLLLRQDWSRVLAGSGIIITAAALLYEIIVIQMRSQQYSAVELLIAIVVVVVLVFIGQYVLRAASIKAFFSKR